MAQPSSKIMEFVSAAKALVSWFESQDIEPRHAVIIMSMVISEVVVSIEDDSNSADERIMHVHNLITHQVKQILR